MSAGPITEIAQIDVFEAFSSEVFKVSLSLPTESVFNFTAGQYLHLVLKDDDKRPFSIASAPEQLPKIELHLRQVVGVEFTEEVIQKLKNESSIAIEGAFGNCVIKQPIKRPICFIVGGTGFSPAKAMIEDLLLTSLELKVNLFWGAGTEEELYLHELPLSWSNKHPNFNYSPVVVDASENWQGATGFVHKIAMETLGDNLSEQEIYIAGSMEMVLAVYKDLLAAGVDKQQIHADMLDILRERGELE